MSCVNYPLKNIHRVFVGGSRLTPWSGPWSSEKYGDELLWGRWEVLPGIGPPSLHRRGRGIRGDVSGGGGPHRSVAPQRPEGVLEWAAAPRPWAAQTARRGVRSARVCHSPFRPSLWSRGSRGSEDVTVPQTPDGKHAPWPAAWCTPSPWPLSDLGGRPWAAQSERRSGTPRCQKDVLCFLPGVRPDAEAPGAAALESARESDVEADSREGGRAHERN